MLFEANYFLCGLALSNIWTYCMVYAKYYAHVGNPQYSVLATILPILSLVAKPVACSIADAHSMHKQLLIGLCFAFGISYGSLGIIPFIKDVNNHDTDFIAWIIIASIMTVGCVSISCIFCMNDALASNYARKHNKSFGILRVYGNIGFALGPIITNLTDTSTLPFRVVGCAYLALFTAIQIALLHFWPYEEDFEMFHDGSTVEQRKFSIVGPNTLALLAQKRSRGSISRDMLAKIRAGRSKSVGCLPQSNQPPLKDGTINKSEEPKEYSNLECQMILIKLIAKQHKSFMRFIFLFVVFGFVQGVVWTFESDFLQQVLNDRRRGVDQTEINQEFNQIMMISIVAQSIGEMTMNLVAAYSIKLFGANANFSAALVFIGLRCFFYANLLPYMRLEYVGLPDLLNGPSLGMYWILLVEVGSHYALMVPDFMPEMKRRGIVRDKVHEEELNGCLRATMIGIFSGSAEGLGVAIGSIAGGNITPIYGYTKLWNLCMALTILTGFVNLGWSLAREFILYGNTKKKEQKEIENGPIPKIVVEETFGRDKFRSKL